MLRSLDLFDLVRNHLTGTIPSSIYNVTKLSFLYLFSNELSGPIPAELGMLRSVHQLQLWNNSLTGKIPDSIGNLSNMDRLHLFMNELSGPIPSGINITHFKSFQLAENELTGNLPENICLGGLLEILTVENNHFSGPIPKTLKNYTSLIRIRLEQNQLSFGTYPNLNYIDLNYNQLFGELSDNWGQCHNLTSSKSSNNNISGQIPPNLGEAREIPTQLGRLISLTILLLDDNLLSSSIPLEIHMLSDKASQQTCSNLIYLNLSRNKFNEDIPSEIGKLQFLQILDLTHNILAGKLPSQLAQLQRLETLNLSRNRIFGSIPSTFDNMLSLTSVDISYNQFEGRLQNSKAFNKAPFESLRNSKDLFEPLPVDKPRSPRKKGEQSPIDLSSTLWLSSSFINHSWNTVISLEKT
ncbi:Leucine-rich repeat - like 10 [Theobroma cacao]|nr:Leucine-rich repeat - like 10 [Theobroma cacao]